MKVVVVVIIYLPRCWVAAWTLTRTSTPPTSIDRIVKMTLKLTFIPKERRAVVADAAHWRA